MADRLHARDLATGNPIRMEWENGVITALEPSQEPTDAWAVPALFDVQVNGYGGVDFQRGEPAAEDLRRAVAALRRDGCPRFFLTLVTDEWPRLLGRLRRWKELRDASPDLAASIAGWHVEGPFLSDRPGFHGAHNPKWMLDPKPAHLRALREAVGTDPLLLTLAPEREGALAAIEQAVSLGMHVSLGHTDASADQLADAKRAGATGFTHLGNAIPRELDRHDNLLWRALETDGFFVGLIADRVHVSPPLFRLIHRTLPAERIYYTTDAMAAAGAPPGAYTLGELELEVGADQVVRQPGKTNFAGSALRPVQGVFRAAEMLGVEWRDAWPRFSTQPARWMGLPGELTLGAPATFCWLTPSAEGAGFEMKVRLDGVEVASSRVP